ncbi:sodium:alanine symporter family protein [Colidextribacter sp. 210702-DFI.3.9]|nr:sodium:alanine symporter family protein [Flintibacter faecis]MCB6500693.1 sodium:alanine symporter family protein [Colidextribacter sp. 210702-DFI.3.9]MCG4469740.1 sodium:alanine symporter family protein [Lawsonibacter sp. DFI.6.74]MCG4773455.1 sodium:alanine symporter family protein [Lawsonibacter sp. DFI.5.51]
MSMFASVEAVLYPVVCRINEYLSNYILVFLLIGVGLWYTVRTGFVQIRFFGEGMRKVFGNLSLNGGKQSSGMTSFQALATAIAAQVGTGNIVGASGAILTGGPGAIFWMWVIAFFGMATIYAEATLAIKTRRVDKDGTIHGGPAYYITTAFKGGFGKFLASFFAVAITLALGFMGCMVQSNSIGSAFQTAFGVPSQFVGVVLVIFCGFIFLGGVNRLAAVTEKVVPVMAVIFLVGAVGILVVRIQDVPATFALIFKYAFQPQAIIGGSFGYAIKTAISQGAKRGLFSNEAGMGSTPHAHAQANVKDPHDQGVVAMVGVFIDTFIVLTLNALVIICTLYTDGGMLADGVIPEGVNKTNLAQLAFGSVLGDSVGSAFVAVCLFFFAFSTVLSWNLFGKINVIYLFGKKAAKGYAVIALVFLYLGTVMSNDLVWELTDMFNNLMVLPNAIALFALTGMVLSSVHKAANKGQKIEK